MPSETDESATSSSDQATSRIPAPGTAAELIEECEVCDGYIDAGTPGHRKSPDERFVHEYCYQNGESPDDYVLDLTDEAAGKACVNRQYNCGHISYGPPRDLPTECPRCQERGLSAMDSEQKLVTDGGQSARTNARLLDEGLHYGACRCTACGSKVDLSHCDTRQDAADEWEQHLEQCPDVELKVGESDGEWITMSDDEPDREWSDWRVA